MAFSSIRRKFLSWWLKFINRNQGPVLTDRPFYGRICLVVINPLIQSKGGRKLSEVLQWNAPDRLVDAFIGDLAACSHGYAQYRIVERVETGYFPRKEDGFQYSEEQYLSIVRNRRNIHHPDGIDYLALLDEFDIIEKINRAEIDEVWTFSFPWAGFYESRMAGPGGFWCNAPPLPRTEHAARRFIIMAFNYERGVGEMLESYGHRIESIMAYVYRSKFGDDNLWEKFIRHEKTHPGRSEAGNVHFAPNSRQDYDWGNHTPVLSRCRTWHNFPDLSGEPALVDCREWGNGDMREHHKWWLRLIPHASGLTDGISNNWWEYIVNPNFNY